MLFIWSSLTPMSQGIPVSDYKGEIRKTCPYHQVDTVKAAAASFISYSRGEALAASGEMMKIVQRLRDKILSTDPTSISYTIEGIEIIAARSKAHNSRYPGSIDEIIPIDPNKNGTALFEKVSRSNNDYIQSAVVVNHRSELALTGSHVKSARKVVDSCISQAKREPIKNLTLDDVHTLIDYQSIQERPETSDPIIAFNTIISQRPDIVQAILRVQAQVCTILQEMVDADHQLQHEDIAYSEFGFIEEGKIFPNSRLLKVLTNNYGPYFHKYKEQSAGEILYKSSLDAEKDLMLSQRILHFEKDIDSYSLVGGDNRACPAIRSVGPIVRHLVPQ